MPEYAALMHFHAEASEQEGEPEAPSASDVTDMFLRMERAGIARIN